MASSCTITVSDITKPIQNLYNLLSKGSVAGYTVAPVGGIIPNLTMIGGVSYVSIQASYTNGAAVVYEGDENTLTNGTRQGKELSAGDTDVHQADNYAVNLNEIYVTASANGAKINIQINYS